MCRRSCRRRARRPRARARRLRRWPRRPKRIAIYVFAWDQQKRETILNGLKAYAKEHGYTTARIYLDSTRACAKLRRLLADAKKGSFELVLVRWVLNLGNRSRLGGLRRARELDAVGVRIESVGEPWFDVHLQALEWIFEDDCRRHERSAKAFEAKRAAGQPAGPIEYGYAVDDDGNVVPDAYEHRVIARVTHCTISVGRSAKSRTSSNERGSRRDKARRSRTARSVEFSRGGENRT